MVDTADTPHKNNLFLLFLSVIIRGVDRYAPLFRACVADAGNDHRLGAMEAPPAIVSIFLGEPLTNILNQLANGDKAHSPDNGDIKLGVDTLPPLPKDIADRNRTSPLAFIGNRFEFRTAGSALSTARPG